MTTWGFLPSATCPFWRVSATRIRWLHSAIGGSRPARTPSPSRLWEMIGREHLFTLRQSLAAFRHYQELIAACDREIAQYLERFESKADPPSGSPSPSKDESQPKTSEPRFDLQSHLHRILGVDLTQVPGINVLTTQTLLAEIGLDLSSFDDGLALAAWLGLCPDNRVSGGKVLSVKTRKVKNRAATALRMAAQSLYRSQSHLGHF
jgi:transposase